MVSFLSDPLDSVNYTRKFQIKFQATLLVYRKPHYQNRPRKGAHDRTTKLTAVMTGEVTADGTLRPPLRRVIHLCISGPLGPKIECLNRGDG